MKIARQALEQGDPSAARIPDTRGEAAELMFMIPKEKLRAFATSNHSSANLIVRTDRLGSHSLRELETAIRDVLAAVPLPAGVHADVTGNSIRINRGADGIAGNQIAQLVLSMSCIFVIVWVVFGRLGLGLLAMPTNVMPVFNFYGLLGAGVATLSIPTSLIGCVALGIAVDDTCHFLQVFRERARARQERRGGRAPLHRRGRPSDGRDLDHADRRLPGDAVLELRDAARVRLPDRDHHGAVPRHGRRHAARAAGRC